MINLLQKAKANTNEKGVRINVFASSISPWEYIITVELKTRRRIILFEGVQKVKIKKDHLP